MSYSAAKQIKENKNASSVSTIKAITVNNADKALKDGNGNVIATTYVTKDNLAQSLNSIRSGLGDTIKQNIAATSVNDKSITAAKLADNAISTRTIQTGAVTKEKLASIHSRAIENAFISVDEHGLVTQLGNVEDAVSEVIKKRYETLHRSMETNVSLVQALKAEIYEELARVKSGIATTQGQQTEILNQVKQQYETAIPTALADVSAVKAEIARLKEANRTLTASVQELSRRMSDSTPAPTQPSGSSAGVTVIEYSE